MRYGLVEHVRPEFARHISGRTDSEWIYALALSQLDDPYGEPEARARQRRRVHAAAAARRAGEARHRHVLPVNLFLVSGQSLLVTQFSFLDYGWRTDDDHLAGDGPAVLQPLVHGRRRVRPPGRRLGDDAQRRLRSLLIASEPLTLDTSTWLEVPEYR